jgi:hypothetical protein
VNIQARISRGRGVGGKPQFVGPLVRILGPRKKEVCPGVDVEAGPALDGERYAVPNVTAARRMDIAVAPDYSSPDDLEQLRAHDQSGYSGNSG